MKFKHASREKLERLDDNRVVRRIRKRTRQLAGTDPESLWLVLQGKYPWPDWTDRGWGSFRAHRIFLEATEKRIKRMHRAYRSRP